VIAHVAGELHLPGVDVTLPLAEIYRGLRFGT
jgi:hypothetical protein